MKTKLLTLVFLAAPLFGTPPRIVNGTLTSLPSIADAERIGSGWIGYSIATPRGFSSCGCRLDSENNNISRGDRDDIGPASSSIGFFVLMRDGRAERVRFLSPDCNIDAGGQTIHWIENVSDADSTAFLRRIVDSDSERANVALLALTFYPAGTDALIDIARHNPRARIRGEALFWLSQEAGQKAAAALRDAVDNDPEEAVRAKAVFGIAQLPNDESIPMLADLLEHNRSREVRKKAAFWLGQKNDPRALEVIERVLLQR